MAGRWRALVTRRSSPPCLAATPPLPRAPDDPRPGHQRAQAGIDSLYIFSLERLGDDRVHLGDQVIDVSRRGKTAVPCCSPSQYRSSRSATAPSTAGRTAHCDRSA